MKIAEIEIINPGGMFFSDMTIAQPLPDYSAVFSLYESIIIAMSGSASGSFDQ